MTREYLPLGEFRKIRREPRVERLLKLADEGFEIKELTPYQFRINGRLDYFPTNDKWHDVKKNIRGQVRGGRGAIDFIRDFFAKAAA